MRESEQSISRAKFKIFFGFVFMMNFLIGISVFAETPKEYQVGKLLEISSSSRVSSVSTHDWGNGVVTTSANQDKDYYIFILIGDLVYVGHHDTYWRLTNKIPQWVVGENVEVKVSSKKDKMWIKKPDGKDFKVSIEKIAKYSEVQGR